MVNLTQILGKNLIGAQGYNLGQVTGLEVSTINWTVTHLQVKLSSQAADELGFKKRFGSSTVCMPTSLVAAVGDVITTNKSLTEISHDPAITECRQ